MRHGFLLIDKPAGPTSHDVVQQVRRGLHERGIGHLGTLDPAASGLLVLAVGAKALKTIELFKDLSKEYVASIRLGQISTTYDRDGSIEDVPQKPGRPLPDELAIRTVLEQRLSGRISQTPPAHSAIHIAGKRAYELVRSGEAVDMPAREVNVEEARILSYAWPNVELRLRVSSGTYIRSIAHDLGRLLHTGAYLSDLRRVTVGEWSVDDAVPPDTVAWAHVQPLKDALQHLPRIDITDSEATDIQHGRTIPQPVTPNTLAWHNNLPIAILIPTERGSRPRKVL